MATYLNIIGRSVAVYLVVLIGLRLAGKRHVGQLSIFDFVLILLISNAVQNAMVGEDTSLLGGIVAAVSLIIVNYVLTLILFKYRSADTVLEGSPTLLINRGHVISVHLAREKITEEELVRVVREHGIGGVNEVKIAVMELDGTISVIPESGEEKKIDSFKRRRSRFVGRKF
ncbi:MAG TPA: YetF domain-containing protein [Bacteroidota bacterium]|nr:YetF domain-containing protein [Bacteroidota bacterium]